MRFISKSSNLMVVLRPGIPGSTITGQQPINGIYIKFSGGVVDVKDEKFIEMLKQHPGFERDFILVDEKSEDPFDYYRREVEPAHIITEMKYGHAEKSTGSAKNTKLSPEIKAFLQEEATKMAKAMLPDMMKEVLKSMGTKKDETIEEVAENTVISEELTKDVPAKTKTDGRIKKDSKIKVETSKEETPLT